MSSLQYLIILFFLQKKNVEIARYMRIAVWIVRECNLIVEKQKKRLMDEATVGDRTQRKV